MSLALTTNFATHSSKGRHLCVLDQFIDLCTTPLAHVWPNCLEQQQKIFSPGYLPAIHPLPPLDYSISPDLIFVDPSYAGQTIKFFNYVLVR